MKQMNLKEISINEEDESEGKVISKVVENIDNDIDDDNNFVDNDDDFVVIFEFVSFVFESESKFVKENSFVVWMVFSIVFKLVKCFVVWEEEEEEEIEFVVEMKFEVFWFKVVDVIVGVRVVVVGNVVVLIVVVVK